MRLVHITESCKGGTATYLKGLLEYQLKKPEKYEVFLVGCEKKLASELRCWPNLTYFYNSSRNPARWPSVLNSINSLLANIKPDLVHSHGSYSGLFARLSNYHSKCKNIYCPHGWSFEQDITPIMRMGFGWIERALSSRTDAIINISWHEAEAARKMKVLGKSNTVILHGIRDRLPSDEATFEFDKSKINIGFVGRLDRQKGIDLLLNAWNRLQPKNLRLHIAGGYDRDREHGVDANESVEMHGWIDNNSIDDFLAGCDALIVPSRWEGFGLVVIEAMRNNLAILASARGALTELVMDDYTGMIFEPSAPDEIYNMLQYLDNDRDAKLTLNKMGMRGRQLYDARHRLPRPYEAVDCVYHDAIND